VISVGPCGPAASYCGTSLVVHVGKSNISFLGIRGLGDYVSGCPVASRLAVASRIPSKLGQRCEEAWTGFRLRSLRGLRGSAVLGCGEALGILRPETKLG